MSHLWLNFSICPSCEQLFYIRVTNGCVPNRYTHCLGKCCVLSSRAYCTSSASIVCVTQCRCGALREIKGLHQALHPSPSMLHVALVLAALRGVAQSASRRNHDTTHTFVCICVCIVGMFTWACQTDFKVV